MKQVKEAQAFFVQVDKLRKARAKGDRKATALSYAASIVRLTHSCPGFPPLGRGRKVQSVIVPRTSAPSPLAGGA